MEALFVYGSLRSGFGHPMGEYLRGCARLLGSAHMPGRVYRVAWYPGAVDPAEDSDRIDGELYEVTEGTRLWPRLDAFEDYDPARPEASLFERVRRTVGLADGSSCEAWVYLYRGPVAGLPRWTVAPDKKTSGA